jgi:hypothetical protein
MPDQATTPSDEIAPRFRLVHDDLVAEYGQLVDIVSSFDQRLLTMKGWGVTLSLATLGAGFQQDHYGLFLVAALSGVAFWLIEGVTKFHQMRYYPRMRDIEVALRKLFSIPVDGLGTVSSPLIDWSWMTAAARMGQGRRKGKSLIPTAYPEEENRSMGRRVIGSPFVFTHVLFPHVVSFVAGIVLFALGLCGVLGPI